MTREVYKLVGTSTGEHYGTICLPEADDLAAAYSVNAFVNLVMKGPHFIPEVDDIRVVCVPLDEDTKRDAWFSPNGFA